MSKINYGYIAEEIHPDDFVFGSSTLSGKVLNPKGDWREFLPIFEHQRKGVDTMSCVTFGHLSALEMLSVQKTGEEPNYSDRFTSRNANTSKSGNTPKRVANSIRHQGTVSESEWPFLPNLDWNSYFKAIPIYLLKNGVKWAKHHDFGYERVL